MADALNITRILETNDIIVETELSFSEELYFDCKKTFDDLKDEGMVKGTFTKNKWAMYTGLNWIDVYFEFDEEKYNKHFGKELPFSKSEMVNVLKCYTIYCYGVYTIDSISHIRLGIIKCLLEQFGDPDYAIKATNIPALEEFLHFVNYSRDEIESTLKQIRVKKQEKGTQRKLVNIINYLVIDNEIKDIFSSDIDDEEFIMWFPLFFWTQVTFILPLRAKEMILTPYNCIKREGDKVYLIVRRTVLKGNKKRVYYDIEKDYKTFKYEIPDNNVVKIIEKYQKLTKSQKRQFLFQYSKLNLKKMMSLFQFNELIRKFVDSKIIGNPKYEYTKYASEIDEFEVPSAGDSRPIAMANLYFSGSSATICMQLADHYNLEMSAHYYTNIANTVMASSIMKVQKLYNKGEHVQNAEDLIAMSGDKSLCLSEKRAVDPSNIEDCIYNGHLEDCMGCRYYRPSKKELKDFIEKEKKLVNEGSEKMVELLNGVKRFSPGEPSKLEAFLVAQKEAELLKVASDINAEEVLSEWQKQKNTTTTFY